MFFAFASLSLALLISLFTLSAGAVWFGGSRLARYVAAITNKTGAGQALMGMLLLGGVTSLPEVAAVSTSAAMGNASLAINNLIGTASINILILAIADIIYGRNALTAVAARPAMLMQGVLAMLLATAVAMIATVGDVAILGFGAGAALLALAAVVALWMSSNFERRHVWDVVGGDDGPEENGDDADRRSLPRLILSTAACAVLILVAGFLLSSTADAIATKTGLAAGIVGFMLIGLATSLPEISSISAALRLRRYQMAIGDIFGTNIFNIMLIFLADIVYRDGPVLGEAGRFEVIGSILTVFMTGIFIIGLLERKDRTILRMGYDSIAAILAFAAGVWLLAQSAG
jgi:cation:H+ antiporter